MPVVIFSSSELPFYTQRYKTEEIFDGGFSPQEITPTPNERFNVLFSITPTKNAPNTIIHFIIPAGLVEVVEGVTEWTGNVNKGETLTLSFSFATLGEVEATVIAEVKNSIGSSGKEYSSSFFLQIATGNTKTAEGAGKIKPLNTEEIKPLNIQAVSTRASIDTERSSMEATPGPDEIRIYGTFSYSNDAGGYSPARYMNVRIMERNSGTDNQIWSGWTNASGSYDVIIDNIDPEGGGRDPYVQLWAIGQWDWETKNGAGATYYWQTGILKDGCEGGEELYAGGVPTANYEAILIGDACFEEAQWIFDRVGWSRPTRVDVRWPFEDWPHSHGDSIHMPTTWGGGQVTVFHEYGHCVMYTLYGNSFPSGSGPDPHYIFSESSGGFAITEGWAEFMQCAVDNDPTNLGGATTNIETNAWYNVTDSGDLDGNMIEGSAASILWDILDPTKTAERDLLSMGFDEIFTVFQDDNPMSMVEFWNAWEARWPDIDTSIGPLSNIYWNYGIDEDWYAPWGGITISGGDDYALSRTVELTLSADDWGSGVRYMRFSEDDGSTWGSWLSYETVYSYTITDPDDGMKRIDVQYADYWGQSYSDNRSPPGTIYDEIILDTTPPTGSIIINFGDPISTTSNLVTLYLTYSDDTSEVNAVRYKNEGEEWSSWLVPSDTKKWILPAGEESKRVYYQIRDIVGHESVLYYDDVGFEPASTSAHIYIEHPYRGDLHVHIGVKNIADELLWTESFWWGEGGNFDNLDLILDISWATSNLPPSENNRWFVEVYDDEIYDEGQISEFTITYMDTEYSSTDPPVPIHDLEKSYAYIPSSVSEPELSLEGVTSWYWTDDTTIESESVAVGDVDGDTNMEVITGGYYYDGTRYVAQLVVWDGATLALEDVTTWYWTDTTAILSVAVGDVDGDTQIEIVTGGWYFDGTRSNAQLCVWDGATLALEDVTTWYWTDNTYINSVAVGDVDGDSDMEIVTGGYYYDGTRYNAQLCVWDGATLAVEDISTWYWTSNTYIESVAIGDVDGDTNIEVITGGSYYDGTRTQAQLVVWDGATLAVEDISTWYWTSDTHIESVAVGDVDGDTQIEIVTGGYYYDGSRDVAQLCVWDGETLAFEDVATWYWTSNTYIHSVAVDDIDGDTQMEIVTGGYYDDGSRYNAQLCVWDGETLAFEDVATWYWTSDTLINSVAIGDVDGDTNMEVITGGQYLDGHNTAQLCGWEYS